MAGGYNYEEVKWLQANAPTMGRMELTAAFNAQFGMNKSTTAIASFVNRRGWIRKGVTGRFQNGHKPWNKGTVGKMQANSGSFQKGHLLNTAADGDERERTMNGYTYMYRRVDGKFIPRARAVWQQENGNIPDGAVIVHIDNDRLNDSIENLMLVTKGEVLELSKMGYMSLEGEMKIAAFELVKLLNKIREIG